MREKLDYMHANPVKRGLVSSPEEWPWSSFRFYYLNDASVLAAQQGLESKNRRLLVQVSESELAHQQVREPGVSTFPRSRLGGRHSSVAILHTLRGAG